MVSGQGGRGGGYILCRKPEEYVVGEILEWMEGSLAPVSCLTEDAPACARAGTCKTLPLWKEYNELIPSVFLQQIFKRSSISNADRKNLSQCLDGTGFQFVENLDLKWKRG